MHPLTSEVLSRFHRTLVEEIGRTRPEYLSRSFTVAEIYQNLVPYRSHRDRIGVEMNGDYEDALLRLLAGEGDYLVLESDRVRRELREELESSNPNTGLFREYAAAEVRLNPERLPVGAGEGGGDRPKRVLDLLYSPDAEAAGADDDPVPVETLAPDAPTPPTGSPAPWPDAPGTRSDRPPSFPDLPSGTPDEEAPDEPLPAPDVAAEAPRAPADAPDEAPFEAPAGVADEAGACRWCGESLPHRENLNYCPFCGANAHMVPCTNCGEQLEPSWRFCVACGTEAAGDG